MADIEAALARCDPHLTLGYLRHLIDLTRADGRARWLWAAAQQELGDVLVQVGAPRDEHPLWEAALAYESALEVYTPDLFPAEHGRLQNNLGNAYRMLSQSQGKRGTGESELDERAITAYLAALDVRTRDADPHGWATTQNNLGNAYAERLRGEPSVNRRKAIDAYQSALEVHDILLHPNDYAMAQTNLGLLYQDLPDGGPDAMDLSMACFLRALLVRTPYAAPRRHQQLTHSLYDVFRARMALTQEGARRRVLARLLPVVEVLTQAGAPLDLPAPQAATAPDTDGAVGVAPDRFDGYWHDHCRIVPLPELVALITSPQAADPRVRITLLRAALLRDDVVLPSFRAELLDELALALLQHPSGERDQQQEAAISSLETALKAYSREDDPFKWGTVKSHLAAAYAQRLSGDPAENLEIAILHAADSLQTRTTGSLDWALGATLLGQLYRDRRFGDPRENYDHALAAFEQALTVLDRDGHPHEWARVRNSMGYTRLTLRRWEREAIEAAIEDFQDALTVLTRQQYPEEWAGTEFNLASAMLDRHLGDPSANLEQAVQGFTRCLSVRTRKHDAVEWARTQHNLGQALMRRRTGDRPENLRRAARCLRAALEVLTVTDRPADHRKTVGALGEVQAHLGDWEAAHEAFASACTAGDLLLSRVSTGTYGFDDVVRQGHAAGELDAYALSRLGRLEEAVEALERSRARSLAEALALRSANPERITDGDRRARFTTAHAALATAQAAVDEVRWHSTDPAVIQGLGSAKGALERAAALREAREHFQAVVAEIRLERDPADFLDPVLSVEQIAAGVGRPVVYLLSAEWGGLALAVIPADGPSGPPAAVLARPLHALTDTLLKDLVQVALDDGSGRLVGGYGAAQEGAGLNWLVNHWPGDTLAAKARHLGEACSRAGKASTLQAALDGCLRYVGVEEITDRPLTELNTAALTRLQAILHQLFLTAELRRCLPKLAEAAMGPLTAWLRELGVTTSVLVPCGLLPAFPLLSVPVPEPFSGPFAAPPAGEEETRVVGGTDVGGKAVPDTDVALQTVGEHLSMTVAPSARSAVAAPGEGGIRSGVYTLGDPRPTHQELRWGEAEALTVAALANEPTNARVRESATLDWLLEILRTGAMVSASCHGEFDGIDFLRSRLVLADGEALTLRDALTHRADTAGLRLLVLSACRTAVMDLRGARDEVRSLAVGMLQAGAQAVLAPLWAVDDRATYLLMVKFAQEWLPAMRERDPADALAAAQTWLRTVTYRDLTAWESGASPHRAAEDCPRGGSGRPDDRATAPDGLAGSVVRGLRYGAGPAEQHLAAYAEAKAAESPDETPYADPYYWAGFQVHGR
ncbi:CHAT domain-containing protein [Streptomyces sp. Je 1-369]|uniref:CHAT domain-containing protein n=1 Tax=Streptomyces sp. Je 1-369 TaxID=2966192 RepID=UPI00228688FC|nr:CHAT domain-containing protein [Streptomyces sp. Je 1-369]WAL93226.1 CHAT domain-containing protein [Streptomyces sp. Je 1-369]